MNPFGFFERRVRGFRVVELGGACVLLVLILTVYLAKTGAGGTRADIDHIQQQIDDEQTQIRLLRAEVANLEQPERLETLATRYLGLEPIPARREITPQALADIARETVVDHKPIPVAADPLLQTGSPDLPAAAPRAGAPAATVAVQSASPAPAAGVRLAQAAPARPGGAAVASDAPGPVSEH